MSENPYSAPHPHQVSPAEERTMGTLAHVVPLVAMIVSAGLLGFVASLVLYLMYKDRGPFARSHLANSLNVQITMGIVILISFPLLLILVGFVLWGAAIVAALVLHILGALKANRGEWWRPPLTIHFVS